MKVSLNTIKQYINFDLPSTDDLVERINQQLGGVEETIDFAAKYGGITIVRVVECRPLEGTDHLNVTKIDDGCVVEGVQRDENGLVQVVCGAPNVRAGMYAVWLAPGLTVPSTYDDAEPFVLGARELRGALSNGMLASPQELALGDSHEGILEIDPNEWKPIDVEIKPGTSFAKAYGLDDTIIDIENKMFTHRPDCFGQLGVAREIAGILHQRFTSPEWYRQVIEFGQGEGLQLVVENSANEKVPRLMAVAVKNVEVKPSPVWLQAELVRLGSKPINNVVDVTNYVMLLTGQPMHAYDYDKVATGKLGVRMAHEGEKLTLLGGKEIELDTADIVITDGEKPIGLGGVMGGAETEVSGETKNIILECANFDMYTIRRTSMRHGLFTDAATRFTKGQSRYQNASVLQLALRSIFDTAGGEQASAVVDDFAGEQSRPDTELFEVKFINERLGTNLDVTEVETILQNVEFETPKIEGTGLVVRAPFWRTDIEILEDIVEEVGRLYGFDKLPQELPQRTLKPASVNRRLTVKRQLRDILSRAGANEVLTYSFVHRNILEKAGQNTEDTYQLSNALSPDLHYLRRTVLPSLLDKVHMNVRAGYDYFALFEIGKGHKKSAGFDEQGVPVEQEYLALAIAGGDFYQAKTYVEFIARKLNMQFTYKQLEQGKLFEPKRGALILAGDEIIGAVGEYRALVRRNFKLPDVSSGFEIDFDKLVELTKHVKETYRPLGRFPSAERDITLKVTSSVAYAEVLASIERVLRQSDLDWNVAPVGIYQPEGSDSKNLTFRLTMASREKTLTSDEVTKVINTVIEASSADSGAEVI